VTTIFVTSSGTDIGKTFVTLQLIAELTSAGYRVRALKPVASGFDAAAADATDSGLLLRALGLAVTPENLDAISPWRFAAPLSPDMAAVRERRAVSWPELASLCRAPSDADVTLIEGIGGVMVPLDGEHTVLDWIAAVGAPALLVVGSYLGTLSHSLTAAAALRSRAVPLAGVVVSESLQQPAPLEETVAVLARFLDPISVQALPRGSFTPLAPLVAPFLP
jgi:dethiobiotin synthetase